MDIEEKNKPSAPHLDENQENHHEPNVNDVTLTIKETIAKNKETIDRTRKFLQK